MFFVLFVFFVIVVSSPEYACHEGNYSLRGMLSAARAEEAGKR